MAADAKIEALRGMSLFAGLRTRDLESETQRLVSVGARILTQQPVAEAGWRWHILSDPEGSVQLYA